MTWADEERRNAKTLSQPAHRISLPMSQPSGPYSAQEADPRLATGRIIAGGLQGRARRGTMKQQRQESSYQTAMTAVTEGDPIPKVLVVDDEPNIRELVQVALKFHGCAVTTSATGADALALAETADPDLIVLDVVLPDIDGFEVCRRLRASDNDVPVIFLTARDTTSDTVTGLTLGGDDYITKPFSVEALVARVRAVLRR